MMARGRMLQGLLLALGTLLCGAAAASCELALGQGEVDLGQIVRAEVDPTFRSVGAVSLGKQQATLNIVCTVPTRLDLYFRAPATGTQGYVVDLGGGGGNALLTLTLSGANADGRPVTLASLHNPSLQGGRMALTPDDGLRLLVDGSDALVQNFSALVEVDVIADVKELHADADRSLQGQGHFEAVERP